MMIDSTLITCLLIALIVAIVVIAFVVRGFLKSFEVQQKAQVARENNKQAMALRFQAYERMVLLIERLSPESLIVREQQQGLTAAQMHGLLLQSIRKEFEHNLAMQLYVEADTWSKINLFRDELSRLINTSAASIVPNAPSLELGRVILEQANTVKQYARQALEMLRSDLKIYY